MAIEALVAGIAAIGAHVEEREDVALVEGAAMRLRDFSAAAVGAVTLSVHLKKWQERPLLSGPDFADRLPARRKRLGLKWEGEFVRRRFFEFDAIGSGGHTHGSSLRLVPGRMN